jgi:hypothetical protein
MIISEQIKNLLRKYGETLKRILPEEEYHSLCQSYFTRHHPPCERKMRRDLKYLQEKLNNF